MAVTKITKDTLRHPELPDKGSQVTWDTSPGMSGFGIRVAASGRVSFVVRYWTGTRERWKTLGSYPRLNLTDARARARKYLRAAGDGRDLVAEEREAARDQAAEDACTVETLAAEWTEYLPRHVTRRGRPISPKTVDLYETSMRLHLVPALGSKPVQKVTRKDVGMLFERVTNEAGPYAANQAIRTLSAFYGWLQRREDVPEEYNPARKAPRNAEQARGEHASVRLTPDQEARLVRALYAMMDGNMMTTAKRGKRRKHRDLVGAVAILTLLDTGRRKTEVLRMKWSRLDLDDGTVDLGSTKGKAAGDVCFLPGRTREAIRRLPRIVGNPFVFTGYGRSGRRSDLTSAWRLVKEHADLESISEDLDGFRLHDLRHHRISELLAAGVAPQLVARQVGHTSLQQLKIYGHLEVADVAKALEKLEPVGPAPEGEVVELREAAQ